MYTAACPGHAQMSLTQSGVWLTAAELRPVVERERCTLLGERGVEVYTAACLVHVQRSLEQSGGSLTAAGLQPREREV